MNDRDRFFLYLLTFLNIPYRWGGANPLQGLDCSGQTQFPLAYHGIDPPGDQSADALYRHFLKHGKVVEVADLGTLLFYGTPELVTHVTTALDAQRMLEAGGGNSRTVTDAIAAQQGAYGKISRINRRADIVAMIHPNGLPW